RSSPPQRRRTAYPSGPLLNRDHASFRGSALQKPPRASSLAALQHKEFSMAAGALLVKTEQIGKVALLPIDHPPLNATSPALRSALKAALEAAIADPASAAIVLIGAGRGFIAGAD